MSEQLGTCGNVFKLRHGFKCELPIGHCGSHLAQCPNPQFHQAWDDEHGESPAPAEPPTIDCHCKTSTGVGGSICPHGNAISDPPAEPVAGETQWSTILGKKDDTVVVASATADWKPPAPAVSAPAEGKPTWEQVCASPLFNFLKRGEGRKIVEEFKAGNISAGKFAQSIVESYEPASTLPPATTVSRDLEGKLRAQFEAWFRSEFPNEFFTWYAGENRYTYAGNVQICWETWQTAAAFGRAEGIEEAAKLIGHVEHSKDCMKKFCLNCLDAEAIRALKEKV